MAKIILGIGSSHSPMLSTPPEQWGQRVDADRQNPALAFRGEAYDFDGLVALRAGEDFHDQVNPEMWIQRHDACQRGIAHLADKFAAAAPDVAVIIGNDQRELFTEDNFPAFSVYWGETIENRPRTPAQVANLPPGIAIAERGHAPPTDAVYPGQPELGRHIIEHLMEAEFDVSQSRVLPKGSGYVNGISHAYGFIYRRIMRDAVVPHSRRDDRNVVQAIFILEVATVAIRNGDDLVEATQCLAFEARHFLILGFPNRTRNWIPGDFRMTSENLGLDIVGKDNGRRIQFCGSKHCRMRKVNHDNIVVLG